MGLLGEVLALADHLRGYALGWFGPLAGLVVTAAQIFAAIIALLMIGAGRGFWAPPMPDLKNFPARMAGMLGLVAVLILYVASRDPASPVSFLQVAICAAAGLLVLGLIYMVAYLALTFSCEDDKTRYIRGLRLDPEARRVIRNEEGPLCPTRQLFDAERPRNGRDYFCRSDRDQPDFVWTPGSLIASRVVLVVAYLPFAFSIIVLLASSALAIDQANRRVVDAPTATVSKLPADLLFEFDSAALRPGAERTLADTAKLIREQWKSGPVVVVGHTDSKGSDGHNLQLSKDRAQSVVTWLRTTGGLANVPFEIQGRGATEPVAPNTLPDGTDNPDGRTRNRRVVVQVPKPSAA